MPRLPRKYNDIGIYHIMVRGNARQDIFIDDQDKRKFVKTILQKRKEGLFKIYAFCIMNNHAHLVVKELEESISKFMKRITTSYAFYFNAKYERVGHVFQDRFRSEIIKNDSYLLSVIRYVHNNPEKANISNKEDYGWSSYREYISLVNSNLSEKREVLDIFSQDRKQSIEIFKDFSDQPEKGKFLDTSLNNGASKRDLFQYIEKFLKDNNINKKDLKDKKYINQRNNLIKNIVKDFNISKRVIAEETGINRETVRLLSKEPSP
jgi:putative transposase